MIGASNGCTTLFIVHTRKKNNNTGRTIEIVGKKSVYDVYKGEGANFEKSFFSWGAQYAFTEKKTSLAADFCFGEKKLARLTKI